MPDLRDLDQERTLATDFPRVLHLGSSKNFQDRWLNLDVNPYWRPDIVADLNEPFPHESGVYHSDRFGEIFIGPETFDEIIAEDVLEHIRELSTAMTSCLNVLKVGGVFRISVPYDLSLGAWSDPTHVRAFNEHSFDHYTKWCWYFGWTEHRFHLERLQFVPSELGQRLQTEAVSLEELLRTPRAIEAMLVSLVKIEMSEEDKQACREFGKRPDRRPARYRALRHAKAVR